MIVLFRLLISAIAFGFTHSACPEHAFLGCFLRLKAQRVPFERNILNLVFSLNSEAKLLHTCKVYSSTLPCFREKISDCGDDKQKRLLNEVSKMLMFMCSPFSLPRQRLLIEHADCISSVLQLPAVTGCSLNEYREGQQVLQCKSICSSKPSDFICMMRTWVSEQNVCTLRDIQVKCGPGAGALYTEMQTTVFDPQFPVLCDYSEKATKAPINQNAIDMSQLMQNTNRQVFMRPGQMQHNIPYNVTMPPAMFVTTMRNPMVWTKTPNAHKAEYTKESWKRKPIDLSHEIMLPTTQHPLFSSTPYGATPKSYKVITLLKNLIPKDFPEKLQSLFEGGLSGDARSTFDPAVDYHSSPLIPDEPVETMKQTTAGFLSSLFQSLPQTMQTHLPSFGLGTTATLPATTEVPTEEEQATTIRLYPSPLPQTVKLPSPIMPKSVSTSRPLPSPPSTSSLPISHTYAPITLTSSHSRLANVVTTPTSTTRKHVARKEKQSRWRPWYLAGSD